MPNRVFTSPRAGGPRVRVRTGTLLLCALALCLIGAGRATAVVSLGTIDTVVGGGTGEGLPAEVAAVTPRGLAMGTGGHLYIADALGQRIRRVDGLTNVVTTVAGTGQTGFAGDGGAATAALLSSPMSVDTDTAGNMYVADAGNNRIRKISPSGIITTIAGTGTYGFSGDGGQATAAALAFPSRVYRAPDGSLLIADTGNNRIRKISPSGVISTVAGTGSGGFSGDGQVATAAALTGPSDVVLDSVGNLYIADRQNCRVRRVAVGSNIITTVAGTGTCFYGGDNGPATSAMLNGPSGVTIDARGRLFIADEINVRVRVVDVLTGIITAYAGSGIVGTSGDGGPAVAARLTGPSALIVDLAGTTLYIADRGAGTVRRVNASAIISTAVGGHNGDGYPAEVTRSNPRAMAWGPAGQLYIADALNNRVRRVDASSNITTTYAGGAAGGFAGDGGPANAAKLLFPAGVTTDGAGNLYISDSGNNRIRRVDVSGIITTVAGTGTFGYSGDGGAATAAALAAPAKLTRAPDGSIVIADTSNNRIRKLSGGIISTIAGDGKNGYSGDGGPATSASLTSPGDVTYDTAGNLYIADTSNCRIRRVAAGSNVITTIAGTGFCRYEGDNGRAINAALNSPSGIVLDHRGNLFIADEGNRRVRAVDLTSGIITTVAGTGVTGYSGDGGPALNARVTTVNALLVDPAAAYLRIADRGVGVIRRAAIAGEGAGEPTPARHRPRTPRFHKPRVDH